MNIFTFWAAMTASLYIGGLQGHCEPNYYTLPSIIVGCMLLLDLTKFILVKMWRSINSNQRKGNI